jgi:hypothetical protein
MAYFKAISQHPPGETEENKENQNEIPERAFKSIFESRTSKI